MDDGLLLAWLPKAVVYLSSQFAIGLVALRFLNRSVAVPAAWFRRSAVITAVLLALALALRVVVQSASAFGAADAWHLDNLKTIAIDSRWGGHWRLQAYASVLMLGAATLRRPAGWRLFSISAVLMTLLLPLLGHGAGSPWRYVLHALHILGAASWLGTVGALALASWQWPVAARPSIASIVTRFSPFALTSSALLFASGVILGWIYVGSFASLWSTPYGRALLWKLGAVGGAGACGWLNWRRVRHGSAPSRSIVTLEWCAAILVLIATAQLTEIEHP